MEDIKNINNNKMTDEERLELADKLDKDLDKFIDGLEKRGYTDGWPEDRWEEEMDKHPFFMKKPPEIGDDIHPLMEGLQQLKYDPEENTKEDLAIKYKEDGNFYVKHKKYRLAIFSYTEGLNIKSENKDINAVLYNNRSAANYFVKNYRSAICDAKRAMELKSDYGKSEWRMVLCYKQLNKLNECVDLCKNILLKDPKNQLAITMRKDCITLQMQKEREERKKKLLDKQKLNKINKTIEEIQKRRIKFDNYTIGSNITEDLLCPKFEPLENYPVSIEDDGVLYWPVVFCYPEFVLSDFQQQLNENTVMMDILTQMFEEKMDCDLDHKYKPNNLNVYYISQSEKKIYPVDITKTIKDIIIEKWFYVSGGCLTFYVIAKNSNAEKEFINMKHK